MQTITRKGQKFVLVPAGIWERLSRGEVSLPELPEADAEGNRPAVEYARVSIARTIIQERIRAGLSRAQLSRRAGVSLLTLNRIEQATVTAPATTIARIEKALRAATRSQILRPASAKGRRARAG